MRRRALQAPKAPQPPKESILHPFIEDWVTPEEISSLDDASNKANERWRAEFHQWQEENHDTAWWLVIDMNWHRAYLVGNLSPTFRDRAAFEWAMALT